MDNKELEMVQEEKDLGVLNCFKNHLQCLRNTRMGFFVDWCPTNPLAAQVCTAVATPGNW